jgi:hypothetical protein
VWAQEGQNCLEIALHQDCLQKNVVREMCHIVGVNSLSAEHPLLGQKAPLVGAAA